LGKIRISPEGICEKYSGIYETGDLVAEELGNGRIFVTSLRYSLPRRIVFFGKYQKFELSNIKLFGKDALSYHMFFLQQPDSSVIFATKGQVIKVKNGVMVERKEFSNSEVIWLSYDENNILWVALYEGGILGFENSDFTKEPKYKFLNSYQISSVLMDKEGSYWFTTLKDGVFYSPNINFLTITSQNGLSDDRIGALYSNKEGVYIGYINNKYFDFLSNSTIRHLIKEEKPLDLSNVSRIIYDSLSNKLWICSMICLHSIKSNDINVVNQTHEKYFIYPKEIARSKSGGYWIAGNKGLMKFDKGNIVFRSFHDDNYNNDIFRSTIYSLVEDNKGEVWFGTMNGLWKYSNSIFQYMGAENPLLSQSISSIIINPMDSSLWLGTNGLGVVVYGKDSIYQISTRHGLASNSVHRLYYSSNEVWAATRQGLSRIITKDGGYVLKNYDVNNGLPSNEITSITIRGKIAYVGTAKGICVFDLNADKQEEFRPNNIITKIKVNGHPLDSIADGIELKYNQNIISFDYVGLLYKNNGKINYRYRMLGLDTNWVYTNNLNCLFSGLSNDPYTFEVMSQSTFGLWNSIPAKISFRILPPFWKQIWFLLLGSFIFSSILFIVYKIRVASINQKNELKHNINLYKQQSLRQQMNPHFIFNTLNSIQLYILEKDPISSHKYLTKFARLMRMTLDNSLNSTIPLRDEIEALKIYLELEKIRLEGKFEYSINILSDESILNIKIPTLLIQPFVENAIWHGIMLKENQSGWVRISLIEENSIVNCTIEDNGVGRVQADAVRRLRNKEHKSRGSQITQQRIELLSLMYKEKFNIQYEDLTDQFGVATGTKVLISIPKGIKANIQK
jgi:hypothetical protein